jgi:hypothetical protein
MKTKSHSCNLAHTKNIPKESTEECTGSDESRYTVRGNDGGARVIRKLEERYAAKTAYQHISLDVVV